LASSADAGCSSAASADALCSLFSATSCLAFRPL
jgi:hypothetical protein